MSIVKIQKKYCRSIHFAVLFPMGSIDDPVEKSGTAHLVEHMTFKKAGQLTQQEIYDTCERLGVKIHARTGKNFMSFQFACRDDVFTTAVNLLSDMLKEQNYSDKDLSEEKLVVLAEILQDEQSTMQEIFDSRWSNVAFSNSILGSEKSLSNISLLDVKEFKCGLLASDFSIVLVGNFNDEDVEHVNELFVQHAPNTSVSGNVCQDNSIEQHSSVQFVADKSDIVDVYYSYHTTVKNNEDALCLYVLDNVLFRGDKAFVTEHLREKKGYIYEIDSDIGVFSNEINWIFKFTVKADNLANALADLEKLLGEFVLTEQYFRYIKAFTCDNIPMLYDDLYFLCGNTIWNCVNLDMLLTPKEFAQKIQEISFRQYNEFFKRISGVKQVYIFGKTSRKLRKEIKSLLNISR